MGLLHALKQPIRFSPASLLRVMAALLALTGLLQILAAFTGNPPVEPFRPLAGTRPALMKTRYAIIIPGITDEDTAQQHWQALQPTVEILEAINPRIAEWLRNLNQRNRIIWTEQATLFNWPVLASYVWYADRFYLGPDFWRQPEGEKAAIIAHEYFHYRQNRIGMIADTVVETLSGRLASYGSRMEDEAHAYQWLAYRAMGMPPSPVVTGYFKKRLMRTSH